MGITKREIASELGVSKRTVANYIEKLGLGNHVSRNGNTDFLDDFAAAARLCEAVPPGNHQCGESPQLNPLHVCPPAGHQLTI